MGEYYNKAKKLVSSKYDNTYEYYNMLVVALTTLLYKYKDYQFLVEKVFNDSDIYIESDSIRNILKEKNIDIVSFLEEEDMIDEGINSTYGVSSLGYSFKLEDKKFVKCRENPFIICSSNCNNTILLNTFIHEFNHLVKSSVNSLETLDTEYSIRSGISYYRCRYDSKGDILYEYNYYDTLDEAINVIETTEMMKSIELIESSDWTIKEYIDSLDNLDKDFGYTLCVSLIRPLWDNPTFRSLIEDNILEGNIENIITSFDNTLKEGSFVKLAEYLEDLDFTEGFNKNKNKINRLKNNIRKMVSMYNEKTSYTYKK